MPQVNGDNLLHQQIVKRTIEALQAQDEAFAIEYETASDADLIAYVRQCVDASYTPAPCEIVGGAYIAQRFGNWSAALKAAGLPSQYKPPREHHYPRYEQEYQRQEVQLLQERKAKRQAKADLVAQRKTATRPAPPPTPRRRMRKMTGVSTDTPVIFRCHLVSRPPTNTK